MAGCSGRATVVHRLFGGLERGRTLLGIDPERTWTGSLHAFHAGVCAVSLLFHMRCCGCRVHAANPQRFAETQMTPYLACNTAGSFTSNTNWQSYSPEATLSYFSNMVALAVQNWASAAAGIAIALAVMRGFSRTQASGLGNFWVDVVRATLYLLLPIALAGALVCVALGVPQNFSPSTLVTTIEGGTQALRKGRQHHARHRQAIELTPQRP